MKTIELVYYHGGGAHRSAAEALCASIERQKRPWRTLLFDIVEAVAPLDAFQQVTGIGADDIYNNFILKRGWWWLYPPFMWVVKQNIRQLYRPGVRLLEQHWRQTHPDLVVALVPYFNRAIRDSLSHVQPRTQLVTVLTDLCDTPPDFWMVRQDQYLICPTARAIRQARRLGFPDDRIFRTSGIVIHPRFYDCSPIDKLAERQRIGLEPDRVTGLVLFGGEGSNAMLEIAKRLDRRDSNLQLIFLCGRHEQVAAALRRRPSRIPRLVEGFTTDIPYYMQLADFFIGKPGALSMSEAITMGLPMIVEHNAATLAQERYNATWIREQQLGLVVRHFRQIGSAVDELLQPNALARYQANVARIHNRAVFEVPEILEKILERRS